MKSPITPLALPFIFLLILLNLCIHLVILASPHLKSLTIALYRSARAYLGAVAVICAVRFKNATYYFKPHQDDGFVDSFIGVAIADMCWAIVAISRGVSRICE
jgi:hypothetical protein